MLTKLTSYFLTDGTPCSPRLLIHPVDANGAPLDALNDVSHATFRSRSRQLIREPLGYVKTKIRQAARDPRALKWEQQLSLEQAETKLSIESAPLGVEARRGSVGRNKGDQDVHGFITANYGSALRYTEEGISAAGDCRRSRHSAEDAVGNAAARGLALPLEPSNFAEANRLLKKALARGTTGWEFDAFALGEQTGDHALLFLGFHYFKHFGLISHFDLDVKILLNLLQRMELSYRRNPYHCRDHGCDVAQGAMWLLSASGDDEGGEGIVNGGLYRRGSRGHFEGGGGQRPTHTDSRALSTLVEPSDVLALLVAALAHDMDHTGQNNAFHVATSSELAIVYNDKSVLENHHCASLFALMSDSSCDIFANIPQKNRREMRDLIIATILSTDMAVHFKNVDRLSAALSAGDLDLSKRDDKSFILEILVHSADIANPCRTESIYRKWTDRVMEEFYKQGDLERDREMTITNFFDRESPNVPKCQIGFINFVVLPLFNVVSEVLGSPSHSPLSCLTLAQHSQLIDLPDLMRNIKANLAAMQAEETAPPPSKI